MADPERSRKYSAPWNSRPNFRGPKLGIKRPSLESPATIMYPVEGSLANIIPVRGLCYPARWMSLAVP